MKFPVKCFVVGFASLFLASCTNNEKKATAEFNRQYIKVSEDLNRRYNEAQRDYCSANIYVAEQGVKDFQIWLLDTNNPTEPVIDRDSALYLINGRLFLIEEHIGNTNQAEKFYQESVEDWSNHLKYIQSLNRPPEPHPLQPISSKEELRDRFVHMEGILDVGWRKQSQP
jgi:hypothetical protein